MCQAIIIKDGEAPGDNPIRNKIILFNKVCENLKNKDKDGWAFLTNATPGRNPPVEFARWVGYANPELQKRDAYHGDGTPFPEAIAWYVREMYEFGD